MDVSPTLISTVTEAVLEEVQAWRNRPLEETCAILYLDALRVKIRDNGQVMNKANYVAVAVNMEGNKEVVELWAEDNEGAKFSSQVMTDLQNRGAKELLHCPRGWVEGLPGSDRSGASADGGAVVDLPGGQGWRRVTAG